MDPLADVLFKAIGEQQDAGEAEREPFSDLAEQLWGDSLIASPVAPVSQACASEARLERMLTQAYEIRRRYHLRLFDLNVIQDRDLGARCQRMRPDNYAMHE